MIASAHQKGLLTAPYVVSGADAVAMARAGADIVVCHLGLTTGGSIGAGTALTLADCPALVDAWGAAALAENPDILVLVHGGPVSSPEDAAVVLQGTRHCHGFYGASSMERLPTEAALTEQTRRFKAVTFAPERSLRWMPRPSADRSSDSSSPSSSSPWRSTSSDGSTAGRPRRRPSSARVFSPRR